MPVQINELIIKANIVEPGDKDAPSPPKGGAQASTDVSKTDIVQECVDRVMEILAKKNER